MLLAVPNVSDGRRIDVIDALRESFAGRTELLDTHSDAAHNRTVLNLAGTPGAIASDLVAGARAARDTIDMRVHEGLHPCIGALDVCPVVWLEERDREAAAEEARRVASRIARDLRIPVFFYGELASTAQRRERAFFRQGGLVELRRRMAAGELRPDLGPPEPHPTAGATLVTARAPMVAFNLELDTPDPDVARMVAASLRESGGGPLGVRAIGLPRNGLNSQVSVNVHDPDLVSLASIVELVRTLAGRHGAAPVEAELVGLAPEIALEGFPEDLPIRGFDPGRQVIERRLAASRS
jgi:glutamate formiminotransferase / 5-formyltetrahydrofolate cyclo-ligase